MPNVVSVNSRSQLDEILNSNDMVVVKFTAPAWCVPCQRLAPHYEAASEKSDAVFVSVDVDNNDWAMVDFGIKGVPQVFLFRDGQYAKTLAGRTVVQLLSEIN